MTMRISALVVSAAVASAILGGCATDRNVKHITDDAVSKSTRSATLQANRGSLLTATSNAFLAGDSIDAPQQRAAVLNQDINYVSMVPVNVTDVASFITREAGVQVDVTALQLPSPGMSPILGAISAGKTEGGAREVLVTLRHSGPLYQLLDQIGGKTASWWSLSDGQVRFFRAVTQTFALAELPQSQTRKNTIDTTNAGTGANGVASGSSGGGAQSGSGGSSAGLTSTLSIGIDPWKDIKENAQAVAGTARVAVDQASGTITVTGAPSEVRQVGEWVKSYNRIASQQVQVTMEVYKVQLTNEDNYGINPQIVFQNLAGKGWALSGVQLPSVSASLTSASLSASIVSPTNVASGTSPGYTGSKLAVQALSTIGKVTETFSSSNVTKNGHPAVFVNGNALSYLYEVSNLLSANVGQEATLTPGTVNTGVSWMATPRVVDGVVHLSVAISDGTLISMSTVSSGSNSIQTPNVNILALQNDIVLHPGESLMLAGMDDSNGSSTHNGIGAASNPLLGGGFDANTRHSILAIVMTAKVL